jgi:hypothetical protein
LRLGDELVVLEHGVHVGPVVVLPGVHDGGDPGQFRPALLGSEEPDDLHWYVKYMIAKFFSVYLVYFHDFTSPTSHNLDFAY